MTETILAFESGLTATRDGLRRAAVREEQLSRKLEARDSETAAFIGVLQSFGAGPSPTIFYIQGGQQVQHVLGCCCLKRPQF